MRDRYGYERVGTVQRATLLLSRLHHRDDDDDDDDGEGAADDEAHLGGSLTRVLVREEGKGIPSCLSTWRE